MVFRFRRARPTIGLALGGGGMRGAAHIGVLKVFDEERLPIDYIAGTSAGSIVAALYACGYSAAELVGVASRLRASDVFDSALNPARLIVMGLKVAFDFLNLRTDWMADPPLGFIRGNRLERWVHCATGGKTFKDTDIPLAIIALDLDSGREVVFGSESTVATLGRHYPSALMAEDQPVSLAVRASSAIPVVFLPRRYGGMNLVDGGVINNVPADALRCWGADIVVAVDLGLASERSTVIDNVVEAVIQTIDVMGQEITKLKLKSFADVVIRPGAYNAGLTDFHCIPELIAAGERAAREAVPEIRALMSRW